jgi:N-carbamoylputrescine amidase
LAKFCKMMSRKVQIGLVQHACTGDREENMRKAISGIKDAAAQGAQIVCLHELFTSLYFCETEDFTKFVLAETIPGPTSQTMQDLAKKLNVVIIASIFEQQGHGIYFNTAAVIDADGSYLGKYRKNHIPDDPGFHEKFYFIPGDTGYQVFNTRFARIGVLICWDQWYPEAARITSLMGAEILFYPTSIGWADSQDTETNEEQYDAWQTIQQSHAIANGIPVVTVNRTGKEGNMIFWGGSFVTNAFGKIMYQAPYDQETVHIEEVDLNLTSFYRVHWPFMRDRRIDTYQDILKRYID